MKAETEEASQKREESIRSENLAREELLIRMKTDADRTNAARERVIAENEFKRQKMFVDTNAAIQRDKMQAGLQKDIEFQQSQQKERDRAIAAQQKLRELAAQKLKERVHLERELVKQQQQNRILQKQREIDRLEMQVDRNLFQQGQASSGRPAPKKLATVQEEPATPPPEATVVLTDSDTPSPSQNRPKPVRRPSVIVNVSTQVSPVPTSEPPALSAVSVSEGPMLVLATGVPLPTTHSPLVIPRGPVAAATPQPLVKPDVGQAMYTAGAQPVGSLMGSKPLGGPVSHLPTGLITYPAYAQQCLAPPLVPSSVLSAPTASSFTGLVSTCVASTLPTSIAASMPSTVAGADTRPTYVSLGVPLTSAPPIVDTKAVPLASVVTTVGAPSTSQVPAVVCSGQTSDIVGPVVAHLRLWWWLSSLNPSVLTRARPRTKPIKNILSVFVFVTSGSPRLSVLATCW